MCKKWIRLWIKLELKLTKIKIILKLIDFRSNKIVEIGIWEHKKEKKYLFEKLIKFLQYFKY